MVPNPSLADPDGSWSATVEALPAKPHRPSRRRRRRITMWASLVAGVLTAATIAVFALAPPVSQVEVNSPLLGQTAPAIAGATITGKPFSLAGLRGHFVVVDFFSSWCVACHEEQPQLERFVAEHSHPGGARLVGVIFEDSILDIRGFLGGELGRYPVVSDPGGRIALDYGWIILPRSTSSLRTG